jgi:hypothetical protein
MTDQTFTSPQDGSWLKIDFLPGVELVLSGIVETGGHRCEAGAFWSTPAGTRQGPHVALTSAELLTVRLGAMGSFGDDE